MPLKHNKINGGASAAKNTLAFPQKTFLLEEIIASEKYFSKLF